MEIMVGWMQWPAPHNLLLLRLALRLVVCVCLVPLEQGWKVFLIFCSQIGEQCLVPQRHHLLVALGDGERLVGPDGEVGKVVKDKAREATSGLIDPHEVFTTDLRQQSRRRLPLNLAIRGSDANHLVDNDHGAHTALGDEWDRSVRCRSRAKQTIHGFWWQCKETQYMCTWIKGRERLRWEEREGVGDG